MTFYQPVNNISSVGSTNSNMHSSNIHGSNMNNPNMFNGINNDSMHQIMMMMIFPMITSAFGTIFQSLINDVRTLLYKLFSYLYDKLNKIINRHVLNVYDEVNELHIPLIETAVTYDRVTESITQEGLPVVWYLNTKVMLENDKLKVAKIYEHGGKSQSNMLYLDATNTMVKENSNKKTLLFVPLSKTINNKNNINSSLSRNDYNSNKDMLDSIQTTQSCPDQDLSKLIEIEKDIYIELGLEQNQAGSITSGKQITKLVLKSKKKSLGELGNFYSSIKDQYEKANSNKSGKLYVYNGAKAYPQFGCYTLDTSQSFDNIFIENKQEIITDILNLEDKEYYKQYGMKRKIGHLYVGPPGSGKTCFVTAIAKLTGRSVVYIPISRIQHNAELQSIIYDRKFNNIDYNMDELIFIADELDSLNSSNILKKSNDDEPKEIKNKQQTFIINTGRDNDKQQPACQYDQEFDKLNIGMILNILDGNNDQDGMIIIGTANSYEKLDPAIFRNGRMELIKFRYMGRNEIANMIEHYYKIKLTTEQYEKIRDDRTVQSLNIKNLCLKYVQKKKQNEIKIDSLIDEINYMFDHVEEVNEKIEKHIPLMAMQSPTSNSSQTKKTNQFSGITSGNEYIFEQMN